ncbi:hypothetical protein HGRIS_012273 [Hohenbuehelia grisea]|uniref:Uncharacterized protein n=1 Tax=Hohenbuehelia grisea TaxID=104357 RepID=A0ABR3IRU5_9AGAR
MVESPQRMHRRKSSQDEEDSNVVTSPPNSSTPFPRSRVNSNPAPTHTSISPSSSLLHPPSAGPFRTSFSANRPPVNGNSINGHASPPFRSSTLPSPTHSRTLSHVTSPSRLGPPTSHTRTRSTSSPFSPPVSSPLSASFPSSSHSMPHIPSSAPASKQEFSTSTSAPDTDSSSISPPLGTPPTTPGRHGSRRHSRMHSRNLSVFFPRPGSLPHSTISEDGVQELEVHVDDIEAPISTIPSAGSSVSMRSNHNGPPTPLGSGFTFGGRPPGSAGGDHQPIPPPMGSAGSSRSRRGHHHKHSMSHSFFSFLEPGADAPAARPEDLHTQPTPTPVSPWQPISPFPGAGTTPPHSATSTSHPQNGSAPVHAVDAYYAGHASQHLGGTGSKVAGVLQFLLGSWLWVLGQQAGSLSSTGLGYWIVFDAFGVAIGTVIPGRWARQGGPSEKERLRRSYGNARVETVLMFAQAVYLMFSSVYVCKETVEHLLLSAGGGAVGVEGHSEGHHHHHGEDDMSGIDFPVLFIFLTFFSLLYTALQYGNHSKLVNLTDNRIPSLGSIIRSFIRSISRSSGSSRFGSHSHDYDDPPTSALGMVVTNPYIVSPLCFGFAILATAVSASPDQHRMCDLVLAGVITVVTFNVAYKASVVLGTVLLQTSPPRGSTVSGRMESFLRTIKEIERHPQVVHVPPPHIWQLAPIPSALSSSATLETGKGAAAVAESLVVTLELHVKNGLGDDDVLKLTRWAWEKCVAAIGGSRDRVGGAEVTVGVVRG